MVEAVDGVGRPGHALINSTSLAFLFDGEWGVAAVAAAVVLTVGVARVVALALGPPPAMGPGGRQTAIVNRSTIS